MPEQLRRLFNIQIVTKKCHFSYIPSLRAYKTCLGESLKCHKFLVTVVVTDCEECNKKAFLPLTSSAKAETLPAELSLIFALPDVVHLGKSLKCSWANCFIDLEGTERNLDIRKKLRKLLSLDCFRNKDRMAGEPIVRLTRSTVLDALKEVTFVVHTVVPEKYRFWKSNQGQSSLCKKAIALKRGSQGKILVSFLTSLV